MFHKITVLLFAVLFACNSFSQDKKVTIKVVQTSDVHGNFYPYCFVNNNDKEGSLSRLSTYLKQQRKVYGDNLILLDNGDILQGEPSVYYYNYIDTVSKHLCAEMMNFLKYDVGNMGNHDIEVGNAVFDRWIADCDFPVLGANIIDTSTGKPYLPPYQIIERDGVKIAILGMITPAIPVWLPENLWKGLRFDDMEESAKKWVEYIQENENPDVLIGLFHAGQNAQLLSGKYKENASIEIATNIPGFDAVLMGHDHMVTAHPIVNINNDTVWTLDPGSDAKYFGDLTITLDLRDGKVVDKTIDAKLVEAKDLEPDTDFNRHFQTQNDIVKEFVSKKIATNANTISTRDAYFGSSAFVDLIHQFQLDITGADISLASPLSFDSEVREGDIYVSDMFNLYRYENMLYVMELTGEEVKGVLEESYYLWTNQMQSPKDNVLGFRDKKSSKAYKLKNIFFNFDSAAGIRYTVDVTKPKGEKITIISMADGAPFDANKRYKVALNSYRGNGGGELLTKGAGIDKDDLNKRIIFASDKDLRYYLMNYLESKQSINPQPLNQWKFIPEKWTKKAIQRDYKLLFDDFETNKK